MAIDPYIAQGGVNVGRDVPTVMNALYERSRQVAGDNRLAAADAAAKQKMQAEQVVALTGHVLDAIQRGQSGKQTAEAIAPQFVADFDKQHGAGAWASLPEEQVPMLAEHLQRQAMTQLGQGPVQETFGAAQNVTIPGANGAEPKNALAQIGNRGSVRQVPGVEPYDPEKFSSPQDLVYNGNPAVAQVGTRGTVRPIPGAAPYNKPQSSGGQAPAGYKVNPDGTMSFIPGGPADPNKPQPTNFSGREAQMFQRVVSSANEAAQTIKNITELPEGASTGWLGVGASPGTGILASAKGVLTNKLASQDVQDFNTMLPGLGRSLATIGTAGLAPPGSLTEGFDKLQLREGDTGYTKLRKLAEYRQIVEKGLETNLDNPRIPKEQKDVVRRIIAVTREAVPFTHSDITQLQRRQQQNPDLTLQDIIEQNGLGKSSGLAAPTNAPSRPPLDSFGK